MSSFTKKEGRPRFSPSTTPAFLTLTMAKALADSGKLWPTRTAFSTFGWATIALQMARTFSEFKILDPSTLSSRNLKPLTTSILLSMWLWTGQTTSFWPAWYPILLIPGLSRQVSTTQLVLDRTFGLKQRRAASSTSIWLQIMMISSISSAV